MLSIYDTCQASSDMLLSLAECMSHKWIVIQIQISPIKIEGRKSNIQSKSNTIMTNVQTNPFQLL